MKTVFQYGLAVILVAFLAHRLLNGGKGDQNADLPNLIKNGALLVDTRTAGEFAHGHIADAINIPYDAIDRVIHQRETDKTKAIVVYCRSGRRSAIAKDALLRIGYTNVVDGGGMGPLRNALKK